MGSSSSKPRRKPEKARRPRPSTQRPEVRYPVEGRRPVDLGRPSAPQPIYRPPPRGGPIPPQPTQYRPLPQQAPASQRKAPSPPRKSPPPPRRNRSPPTQAGNRQSVYWYGLTGFDYQSSLPPDFSTETAPGASLIRGRSPPHPTPPRKTSSPPRRAVASPPSSSNSRDSVYFPGLTENMYQEALPPSFVPQSLIYSALHPATMCKRPTCPIDFPHCEGVYQHDGVPSGRGHVWGICNPPPEIWAVYEKQKKGKASEEEKDMVLRFTECHAEGYNQKWRKDEFSW